MIKRALEIVVFLFGVIIQFVLAREAKRTAGARVDGAIKAAYIRMRRLNVAIKIMLCPEWLVVGAAIIAAPVSFDMLSEMLLIIAPSLEYSARLLGAAAVPGTAGWLLPLVRQLCEVGFLVRDEVFSCVKS